MRKAALVSVEDEPPNITVLVGALRYLAVQYKTQPRGTISYDMLLALATYSEHLDFTYSATYIAETVLDVVQPAILQDMDTRQEADREVLIALQEQQNETTEKIYEEIAKLSARMDERMVTGTHEADTKSYANITASGAPHIPLIPPPAAAYQNDLRSRQILVEGFNSADPLTGKPYEEPVLLQKASVAFNLMGICKEDAPFDNTKDSPFVAVSILRSGTLAYELSSREMAVWMRKPDVETAFLEKYGGDSEIRLISRSYPVIAYHVPVSFDPTNPSLIHRLAIDNDINPSDIQGATWMKAVEQRKSNQAVAHLRINLAADRAANTLLRRGTVIGGRRLKTHKWIPDPKRCFKCQELNPGHFAAECKAKQNTCGTCGAKSHRTQECQVADTANFFCSNCKKSGHGTWSRSCPAMLKTRARMLDRQPEYRYVLYPIMNDPSTWEQIHDPDTHFQAHDTHPPYSQRPQVNRQTGFRQELRQEQRSSGQTRNWADEVEQEQPWQQVPTTRRNSMARTGPSQQERSRAASFNFTPSNTPAPQPRNDTPLLFPSSSPPDSPKGRRVATPLPDTPVAETVETETREAILTPRRAPIASTRVHKPGTLRQSTLESHVTSSRQTSNSSATAQPTIVSPSIPLPARPRLHRAGKTSSSR